MSRSNNNDDIFLVPRKSLYAKSDQSRFRTNSVKKATLYILKCGLEAVIKLGWKIGTLGMLGASKERDHKMTAKPETSFYIEDYSTMEDVYKEAEQGNSMSWVEPMNCVEMEKEVK